MPASKLTRAELATLTAIPWQQRGLLRLDEVAVVLNCTERHVRDLAKRGLIVIVKDGRLNRVTPAELQRHIDAMPTRSTENEAPKLALEGRRKQREAQKAAQQQRKPGRLQMGGAR